jgi:hypothetical protein
MSTSKVKAMVMSEENVRKVKTKTDGKITEQISEFIC